MQGQNNTPLSEKGLEMANRLSGAFQKGDLDRIVSSDLCRAIETAKPTANKLGLRIETFAELREGRWGKTDSQPGIEMLPANYKFETRAQARDRMIAFMNVFAEKNTTGLNQNILMVAHSATVKDFIEYLNQTTSGLDKKNFTYKPFRTALNKLVFDNGNWKIEYLNKDDHLQGISEQARLFNAG
jgi:broad specificity phosphatase PhoE